MTQRRIDPALTVNEILLHQPTAVSVLNTFGIDSCCGGGTPLDTVVNRHGLDITALMNALDRAVPKVP
jgi:iron-sulfur cluster repair protein YtfE (RIC family)